MTGARDEARVPRWGRAVLAWVVAVPLSLLALAEGLTAAPEQPALLALATFTVAGLLVLAVRALAVGTAPARVRTTLRDRSLRTAFLPQRDPDAAGRPRPRAPGTAGAAA
ncbi:DUF6412 domain-containing protein [Actinomadura sp. NEAU-AAG7]|uniref:DUF6412 domain-containing protein n=1 Tax=Actinomadura sp. NEAU-AAG7 TaxID=2839640 RepID=UPI001BE3FB27|nr:DUF6412 domain-containing protein [Actinomadura sp. NEAU-AAG7]MBT2211154.1 hypothetical protein [Actinomadura sp. NEAU-AAG7]